MKQDRFLTGILIGIAILVVVALVVFFIRKDSQSYISEDTPEGVVHNYVLAVLNSDYKKAYEYLADLEDKPTYEEFKDTFIKRTMNLDNSALNVGKSEVRGDTASVEVIMFSNSNDPFSSGYRNIRYAVLVRQKGAWKISFLPGPYFQEYDWYQ